MNGENAQMPKPTFSPGFRFSVLDGVILLVGIVACVISIAFVPWMGFVVGFTLAHFFLFCNVFRLSRTLELVWAGVFVALCSMTILQNSEGWYWTAAISLLVTILVVVIEIRKPSYHGVAWEKLNPGLRAWWESRSPNDLRIEPGDEATNRI